MKPLPENPEPYLRPEERWFENHKHYIDDDGKPCTGTIAVSKTLNAMWLMLHDRTRRPIPTKPIVVNISERDWLISKLQREPNVMAYWGELCDNTPNNKTIPLAWATLTQTPKGGRRGR